MSFTPAPKLPETVASNTTGIGISVSISGKVVQKTTVRLSFTAAAQERVFGTLLDPESDRIDVLVGRGQDEGKLRLRVHKGGEFNLHKSVRGSCNVKVGKWDLLSNGKRPAASCIEVGELTIEGDALCATIELPEWSKPSARGGKMDQEFGLKRAK